jgi:hypothetical protein
MKTMTYLFMSALIVVQMVGVVGCSVVDAVRNDLEIIGGSGNMITRTYDERDFTEVATGYGATIDITAGDEYAVTVEMDDNLEPYVEVTNTGGRLSILLSDNMKIFTNTRLNIDITMPELKGISLSGGSIGTITGFGSQQPFHVELSGGSVLHGDIESSYTGVDISGGSQIDLTGTSGDLELNASGGSFAFLGGFTVEDVTLDVSGGGEMKIHPTGTIRGHASGGAMVQYDGNPTSVEVQTSGGAQVSKR